MPETPAQRFLREMAEHATDFLTATGYDPADLDGVEPVERVLMAQVRLAADLDLPTPDETSRA